MNEQLTGENIKSKRISVLKTYGENLSEKTYITNPAIGRDEQIAVPIDPTKYPEEYVTTSRLKAHKNTNRYYVVIQVKKYS